MLENVEVQEAVNAGNYVTHLNDVIDSVQPQVRARLPEGHSLTGLFVTRDDSRLFHYTDRYMELVNEHGIYAALEKYKLQLQEALENNHEQKA